MGHRQPGVAVVQRRVVLASRSRTGSSTSFPNLIITDSIGSTESGFNGLTYAAKGDKARGRRTHRRRRAATWSSSTTTCEVIPPGDERVGKIGRGGNIPLGYFNDPVKTAETFVIAADGRRYAVSGDFARWTDDGQLTMLGRGSVSINSGGEKIYPEEVEQALKAHPAVFDCIVVGVPDERWGQRVAAVVQFRDGERRHARRPRAPMPASTSPATRCPRELHLVDEIVRSPVGQARLPLGQAAGRVRRGPRRGSLTHPVGPFSPAAGGRPAAP